jgi:RNA polymerase sigma-70 factor (ECF subfamily)
VVTTGHLVAGHRGPGGAPDAESAEWVQSLQRSGAEGDAALQRLHVLLLRAARAELKRRASRNLIGGAELDDLAHQACADAMVAITAKLDQFRHESRFTTWAYRFVILEVSNKLGRHFWNSPQLSIDEEDWDRLPGSLGFDPHDRAEWQELIDALRRAIDETLTPYQRRLFVAIVLNGVPADALAVELDSSRNAIYKALFDARRKLRQTLVANGYMELRDRDVAMSYHWVELERFLATDPRDVGCEAALKILHVYSELFVAGEHPERRFPGVAAHLEACGPCGEDFAGLVAAIGAKPS